jgi:hemolysin activation/secretion protein
VQVAAVIGRGVSGGDDRPFIATEVYAGVGGPRSFASARATVERRSSDTQRAARLASGRLAWYWRVSQRQTQEVSAEFTGIWREDTPVALFLDDRLTGPRGYDGATASGTRLLVGRFERRIRMGGFGKSVGLGAAGFLDVAKLWSGDAPLGVTTDPVFGAGAGFLVAIPRNSRKTIRLDASYPFNRPDGVGGFDIRLTVTTTGRAYSREPAAFQRSRVVPMLRSLLGWF